MFGVARNVAMKFDAITNHRFSNALNLRNDGDDEERDQVELASDEMNPLERLLSQQMAEDLRAAIACLAPHYRDVLILYELQELSYLDIADICQINVGTVRSRLSRARLALAERLQMYRDEAA